MIAVQLIDSTGRVLGNLRLPAGVRLVDLEQLALAAGSASREAPIEQQLSAKVRARAPETEVLA